MTIKKIISEGVLVQTINNHKFSSIAHIYLFNNEKYVIREIGRQYSLKSSELGILEKNINEYYKILAKTKTFRVPNLFELKIDNKENRLLLLTEYFENSAIKKDYDNLDEFKKIAKVLFNLINNKNNINQKGKLNISVDTNPDNFFIVDNDIVYNDFTPPLFRQANGEWVEFRRLDEMEQTKKNKEMRYFNRSNILVNFLNKARLYLVFDDYIKLVDYVFTENSKHKSDEGIKKLFVLYRRELAEENCNNENEMNLNKYITERDISRFKLTLKKELKNSELIHLFKRFKNTSFTD